MGLNYVVIDIIFGIILTFFVGVGCYKAYYNSTSDRWIDHWIPQTIISGLIIISISVGLGIIDDTNMRIEKSIKNTITANYDDVLNYHNEDDNKTFASGDSRYTFDYDENTKTLIVFTGSKIDAVFVNGVKKTINRQKGEKSMTTTTGIFIGIAVALVLVLISVAGFRQIDTCEDHDWVPIVIIEGIFFTGLLAGLFGSFGHETEKEEKVNIAIKTTVNANYNDVVNFHNDDTNKSFVSNGSKYTFDYDEETKTLTVFTDTSSSVDAVFVNGVKQDSQNTSDKTDKNKDCISYKTDDTDEINSKSNADNNSSSTAVSLQQKIQDKIQSRYSDAVITGFDTIKMSGTFSCDNVQYNFQWKDDMLKVINADDADDVTYYKVAQ